MDNLDDSENNAKISDSAYSNSCSNSQSRRSHSSKSTHCGSNSSGSSGYGGKPSTSGSSNQPPEKRIQEKDPKKEKKVQVDTENVMVATECQLPDLLPVETPKEEELYVDQTPSPALSHLGPESMNIASPDDTSNGKEEIETCNLPSGNSAVNCDFSRPAIYCSDGFSCVISMHDGVVMYTTSSLTTTLGFPKDMWIGRSFIDFIHPRDRNTVASQITSGLATPKIVNGTQEKVQTPGSSLSTMVCRIRRYRGLSSGFGVKERGVTFLPFLLKLTFKNVSDEKGELAYLVIQATQYFSAFKVPNEIAVNPTPFVMRHAADGALEYIDPESVPYLGYLPQDLIGQDALKLYHPDDLCYLNQVYVTVVMEGGFPRSKPYRMLTQNGDYIKLATEWSSYINPWSRKLEFVIGKHHIIEGPTNPDVFQITEASKANKIPEAEKIKQQLLRDNIIQTMNEVLTKPAEVAKQQMSKRCQDVATFMESLMDHPNPKADDELRLEIQEGDHSYYGDLMQLHCTKTTAFGNNKRNALDDRRIYNERDSLLGGISPHHDCNDSKSSTETPLSYNQLNYNENLERYFNSHQPFSYEDYNTVTGENILGLKDSERLTVNCLSPTAQHSGHSSELTSSGESAMVGHESTVLDSPRSSQRARLTELLLHKHNAVMEKELFKVHRGTRSSSKGEREKTSNEKRQKKKEHLARCNATFQPAAVGVNSMCAPEPVAEKKSHGVKRHSKPVDAETAQAHKHHCSTQRQTRRRHTHNTPALPSASITTTVAAAQWHHPYPPGSMNNMNTFLVGFPQQMQIMSPVMSQQVQGMYPLYYTSTQPGSMPTMAALPSLTPMPSASEGNNANASKSNPQFQAPTMQYMMYGQPMYGPLVYSPINPQAHLQQSMLAQTQYTNNLNPLPGPSANYEEYQQTTEAVHDTAACKNPTAESTRMWQSDETAERTDRESSYSSFYSSFFKTESSSAEDSGELKKEAKLRMSTDEFWNKNSSDGQGPIKPTCSREQKQNKTARRKMEPPWMEQVCVNSELIYKYQVLTKTLEDVLSADKEKITKLVQPSLVNEQLGQLYLDLQLEGVAARLSLEEGITSSSSSGEETTTNATKTSKRKRQYSKLVMIYEEDAPLPPPSDDEDATPATTSN